MIQQGPTMTRNLVIPALLSLAMLAGCGGSESEPAPPPQEPAEDAATIGADGSGDGSIMRSDIDETPIVEPEPEPIRLTLSFADGGSTLTDTVKERLTELAPRIDAEQSWPIIIRGHSDADGSGDANTRVSQRRAQAVADFLVEQGVDEASITVIAFGAQNPKQPNALPDGSPNEAGRRANRRVELTYAPEGWQPEEADTDEDLGMPAEASRSEASQSG